MYVRQMVYILLTDICFYWTPYVCHNELRYYFYYLKHACLLCKQKVSIFPF